MIKEKTNDLLKIIRSETRPELVTKKKEFISLLDQKIKLIKVIERVKKLIIPASINEENNEKVIEALEKVIAGINKIKQINLEQQKLSKGKLNILLKQETKIIEDLIENIERGINPKAILNINEFSQYLEFLEKSSYMLEAMLK